LGKNIFSEDWDVLIILDACRVDALRTVSQEYLFTEPVDSIWSVGSTSQEWLVNTFTYDHLDYISDLALITGNAWTESIFEKEMNWGTWTVLNESIWEESSISNLIKRDIVSASDFHTYLPVWEPEKRDGGNAAPRAEEITDAAITVSRELSPPKMLVHYMQPHAPFFFDTDADESLDEADLRPFEALGKTITESELWGRYLNNLRYVLDSVKRLLRNIDADKVVITADHGELFGELGIHGHPAAFPHPAVRKVPWVETKAEDSGEYTTERTVKEFLNISGDIEQRLKDLGYL
jgi:hypothetical protein